MAVRAGILAALLALSACGSEQAESMRVLQQTLGDVWPFGKDDKVAEATAEAARTPAELTRAQIEATGTAMIRARLATEASRSIMSAATVNGGYVSYISRFGQMVTMNGSLVTGTRGLGYDLLSVQPGAADPVSRPLPLANWPAAVTRIYFFPGDDGPEGDPLQVNCSYVPGETRQIEIVEITYTGIQVEEQCAGVDINGQQVAFSNYHFVNPRSGMIWRTLQWVGPQQGFLDVEILEPFDG
ncbi:YjbF family lipoprotein [Halovulum sp. GXIMD14794]